MSGFTHVDKLPPALAKKCQLYAQGLKKRNPKMKTRRLMELTAKKFNIKLVELV